MARDNFSTCLDFTLKWEGSGYTDDPRDPGGATKWGVTLNTLAHWRGKPTTKSDVMGLTREEASAIYRNHYWDTINADALARGVDLMGFDIAVNMGAGRSLGWLAECKNMRPFEQIEYLDGKRRSFWRSLKTWAVYGKGWSRREDACVSFANVMLRSK